MTFFAAHTFLSPLMSTPISTYVVFAKVHSPLQFSEVFFTTFPDHEFTFQRPVILKVINHIHAALDIIDFDARFLWTCANKFFFFWKGKGGVGGGVGGATL